MALVLVLLLVAAAMLAPGLVIGPSIDAAVFSDIGNRILHGVTPYVDVWDHKPPGIYAASAGVHAVLGWLGPWTPDWLLSLVSSVAIGVLAASLLSRAGVLGWPRSLAAIGATIVATHYLLALGGGLTEPPATAFAGLGLVLALGPPRIARGVLIGISVAVSALLSVQLVPAGLVVLGLALLQSPRGTRWRVVGVLAVGLAAPIAVAGGWLLGIGAMPAALDALVTYSSAYRASGSDYAGKIATSVAAWTMLASLFLVAPAILGAVSLPRLSPMRRIIGIASLVWILGTLIFIVIQLRFYAHYAIPLTIPLGVLAGLGLERIGATLGRSTLTSRRLVVIFPLLVSLIVSSCTGVVAAASQMSLVVDQNARSEAVAARLRRLPAGGLLVWGNVPLLYTLADRAPAMRYTYFFPLTTRGYTTTGLIRQIARELATNPPEVVVDAGSNGPGLPGFLPLLVDRPIETEGRDLDLLDPLRAFVAAHYRLDGVVSGWPVYVLREAKP